MTSTEVILIEKVEGLGAEADVVKVKPGYARNFLIPRKMAYAATAANLRRLNLLKAKRAEREAKELNEAEELARRINKVKLSFTLETGGAGKAFGSVTAQDLAEKLKGELGGREVDRHRIVLEKPIKETGAHEVPIRLHPDVTATLRVQVSAAEKAERPEKAEGAADTGPRGRGRATRGAGPAGSRGREAKASEES